MPINCKWDRSYHQLCRIPIESILIAPQTKPNTKIKRKTQSNIIFVLVLTWDLLRHKIKERRRRRRRRRRRIRRRKYFWGIGAQEKKAEDADWNGGSTELLWQWFYDYVRGYATTSEVLRLWQWFCRLGRSGFGILRLGEEEGREWRKPRRREGKGKLRWVRKSTWVEVMRKKELGKRQKESREEGRRW